MYICPYIRLCVASLYESYYFNYRKPANINYKIFDNHAKNNKYGIFVSISSLTGECAAEKIKNFCSSSLWTCLHNMVILGGQNKITDFFMILTCGCLFQQCHYTFIQSAKV